MRLRLPAPTYKKIGSGSGAALKVAASGGSGSATLNVRAITHCCVLWLARAFNESKEIFVCEV